MGRKRRSATGFERARGEMARAARERAAKAASTEKPTQAADTGAATERINPYERLLAKLRQDQKAE